MIDILCDIEENTGDECVVEYECGFLHNEGLNKKLFYKSIDVASPVI